MLNKKWQRKKKKQQYEKNILDVSPKDITLLHSWKKEKNKEESTEQSTEQSTAHSTEQSTEQSTV